MAASTSTAANLSNNYYSDYDVFLNHRGPDTKQAVASVLYHRLSSLKLRVFLDEQEMEEGDFISSQIESAIKTSTVQVAIFSPGYANSTWCLRELVLMLETLQTGATLIPIFYNVEPCDLQPRGDDQDYAKALKNKETRHNSSTIEEWRKALSKAAGISGFVLKACNGGEELDKVVTRVFQKVKRKTLNVADHPTGLDDKVKDFEENILLQQPQIVGIVGSGGVGKTTLAKELFNRMSLHYSRYCFLPDIRETPSLISLQNKLLTNLTRSNLNIDNIDLGITALEQHLSFHKALIILDDVDNVSQVKALFPTQTVLHSGSLILITSRNKDVLISSGVEDSFIYPLTRLNTKHSRELFCWHSFKQPHPPVGGFEYLVDEFLKVCDGLPLSLIVFGALLYGQNEAYWGDQLKKLQYILPAQITQRLKISYDALDTEEKEIFLDIACFFTRYNRDTAIRIWDGVGCKGTTSSFQKLQNRCLVRVDTENDIQIHDHLRDMGRDIAEDLGRRDGLPRRLWRWTDNVIDDLLERGSNGQGITVRGIKMDLTDFNAHKDDIKNELEGITMRRLQLLDTEEGILEHILLKWVKRPNLIWLRWEKCLNISLPSCISMKNLRVLQVSGSVLKTLWEDDESKTPLQLRELEVYAPLRNIPKSIGRLEHLERIVVGRFSLGRVNLTELPEEFCDLQSLKALVLRDCSKLKSLPVSFGKLTTLEHIDLSFCRNLKSLPNSFGSLRTLQYIDLSDCYDLESLPDSFDGLHNLQRIDLPGCHDLERLPDSFCYLRNLQHINLSGCHRLKKLPDSFGDLSNLQYIDLSRCHNLGRLPGSFGTLTNLRHINLSNCHDLVTLPDSIDDLKNLQHIDLSRCHNLERLPNSLRNSIKPNLEGCSYLTS